jgi:diaminopimelate epimerase
VGETLSCGTGASAAAAVALRSGRLSSPVDVRTRGGALQVHWSGQGELFLAGGVARCRPAAALGRRR